MVPRSHRLIATGILTFASALVPAQTPPLPGAAENHSPVGRWLAEHPSKGGIGSWWDFRADGTLTMYFGVVVTDHIDRSGNTFMTPSGVAGGERLRARYTIANNVLSIETGASKPTTYSRIGTAPNPADPLIGSWRPLPLPATASGNPEFDKNFAIMQTVMSTKGVLVFTPDGMQYLRVPLGMFEGTWDDRSHTFHLQKHPGAYSFERKDSKLVLGQPPSNRETDIYLPDPLPEIAPGITSATPTENR